MAIDSLRRPMIASGAGLDFQTVNLRSSVTVRRGFQVVMMLSSDDLTVHTADTGST